MKPLTHPVPSTRAELLALTPKQYLREGLRDRAGVAWPELTTSWALAASEQLRAAKVTAAEFDAAMGPLVPTLLDPHVTVAAARTALSQPPLPLFAELANALRQPEDAKLAARHLAAVLSLLGLEQVLGKQGVS